MQPAGSTVILTARVTTTLKRKYGAHPNHRATSKRKYAPHSNEQKLANLISEICSVLRWEEDLVYFT